MKRTMAAAAAFALIFLSAGTSHAQHGHGGGSHGGGWHGGAGGGSRGGGSHGGWYGGAGHSEWRGSRHAWHGGGRYGGRVIVGIGPWWAPYSSWYYPSPYYGYAPPVIVENETVVEEPRVYTQRDQPEADAYWYYCPSAEAYYPDVKKCSEAWIKVPPRP